MNSESMLTIEQNGMYCLHVCLVGELPVCCIRPFVLMVIHEFLQGFFRLPIPVLPKCDSRKMKHVISTHKAASSNGCLRWVGSRSQ